MNEYMVIKKLVMIIHQNLIWIVGIIAISVMLMFLYVTFIATPIYQKSTQILVSQSEKAKNDIEAQTVQADLQLVNTYSTIISSPRILNKVNKGLKEKFTLVELSKMIQVKNTSNSQVIEIDVNSSDPKEATRIANLTAAVFTKEIPNIMKINNVVTLSPAVDLKTEHPVRPQKELLLVISFCLGVIITILFIVIKMFFERSFTSTKEIEELLELPVLGEVSHFKIIKNRYC